MDPRLFPRLIVRRDGTTRRWTALLLFCTWTVAVIALAGPTWSRVPAPRFRPAATPLVIVLDLSRSMDAADVRPSRLAAAKIKIARLLETAPRRRTALVVYSARPHLVVPLTEDRKIMTSALHSLSTDMMPARGSNAAAALRWSAGLIVSAGERKGEILLVTDGVDDAAVREAARLAGSGVTVSVLAVATEEGGPVIAGDGTPLVHDGKVVRVRLEEGPLRSLARAGKGRYALHTRDDGDIESLGALGGVLHLEERIGEGGEVWRDEGALLVLLLIPFAAAAFRKGWLFVLLLAAVSGISQGRAEAFDWTDLWLNGDQQGVRALNRGDPASAAELFRDPLWRGVALYLAGEFEAAAETFSEMDDPVARYNLGSALVMLGRYDEAVEAFEKALLLDPGNRDVLHNLAVVRKFLGGTVKGDDAGPLPPPGRSDSGKEDDKTSREIEKGGGDGVPEPVVAVERDDGDTVKGREGKDREGGGSPLAGLESKGGEDKEDMNRSSPGAGRGGDGREDAGNRKGETARGSGGGEDVKGPPQRPDKEKKVAAGAGDGETPPAGDDGEAVPGGMTPPDVVAEMESKGESGEGEEFLPLQAQEMSDSMREGEPAEASEMPGRPLRGREAMESRAGAEQSRMALMQWLDRIPDDPGGLLREKFRREYLKDPGEPWMGDPW